MPLSLKTSLTHADLIVSASRWAVQSGGCTVAYGELVCAGTIETPDVIGFGYGGDRSVVIECKVSRSDFLADRKKPFRQYPWMGMGQFRFFCCPVDLITVRDLPEKWGLIYVNQRGKPVCVHNPYNATGGNIWTNGFGEWNAQDERRVLYSALIRKK